MVISKTSLGRNADENADQYACSSVSNLAQFQMSHFKIITSLNNRWKNSLLSRSECLSDDSCSLCFASSGMLHNQRVVLKSSEQCFSFFQIPPWQNHKMCCSSGGVVPVPFAGPISKSLVGVPEGGHLRSFTVTNCMNYVMRIE